VGVGERGQAKVISQQQLHFGELPEHGNFLAKCSDAVEFVNQSRQAQAAHADFVFAGVVGDGAGEVAFADAGRSYDEQIELLFDPLQGAQGGDQTLVDAARYTLVEVFKTVILLR